jgi:isopenicillin N synthase-like dioxygenase
VLEDDDRPARRETVAVRSEFDPGAKERELRAESSSWETSVVVDAEPGDIPVVDISAYVESGSEADLATVAALVNDACETVGFFQLIGHTVQTDLIDSTFDAVRAFHDLPVDEKQQIAMDRADWPLGGVGYLGLRSRKLPSRDRGNLNEAFLIKGQEGIGVDDNQWLADDVLPGFRTTVETYASAVNELALRLLPIYATALGLDPSFFSDAFRDPTWRLRMTHYPPDQFGADDNPGAGAEYGIAPHVDTTFFTLLLQDGPGLTIYSHPRDEWITAPVVEGAYVVNSGELLKHWTNDRYLSVRHFANNDAHVSRYSIPFFYNATASHPMECLPTCCSDDNPPKYPPISYGESQAVAQGE